MSTVDSFGAKSTLTVGSTDYEIFRIDTVAGYEKLPFSLKVLLENLLRTEDGANVTKAQIEALGSWDAAAEPDTEIQFTPARVVMQDFTGVPCIVDLATMREAVEALGGDPKRINPLSPAEMVIDHSVIADLFGTENALERNVEIEYERNGERYQFLRWGQTAFDDFKVVPPGTGIVHQVNIEHLAKVIYDRTRRRRAARLPRHVRRHRLAHHDGQRPRRARLGRRRHRGRGRDARPAGVDAHPEGRRLQALRRDPDRRHRDRRRAHDHRDAAQARRRRQVRRVLRRGRRLRAARQPRHDRQHEPRVRLDRRDVPDRRRHARLPAPHRSQRASRSRSSRRTRSCRRCGTTPTREPVFSEYLELDLVDGRPLDRRPEASAGPHHPRATRRRSSRATSPTTPTSSTISSTSRAPSRSRHPTRPGNSPDDEYSAHTAPPPQPRADEGLQADPGRAGRRREVHARPRRRHDRGDHVVHEHVEPVGHARGGPARPQRGQEGPEGQAVGQDHPRARARRSSPTTTRRPA